MLRIAVCLSGHMRSYATASVSLFENIAPPGRSENVWTDYYVHTWSSRGPGAAAWDCCDELDIDSVGRTYRPQSMCIERDNPESWPSRSMFRKIELAHRMAVDSGREYDVFVRARPDTLFLKPVDLSFSRVAGTVYLPSRAHFGGLCDQFAFGDAAAMGHYSSLFSSVAKDDNFHPESKLKAHLSSLTVEFVDVYFKILRSDGTLYNTMCI